MYSDALQLFCYAFYALEQSGLLDVENPIHLFTLHLIYLPRINFALYEFMIAMTVSLTY